MFEFDIEKYEPKTQYTHQGVQFYLCGIRKKLIKVTKEERVRQAFINYLINEKQFPLERIQIEVPLSRYKKGAKGRADLIVLDTENDPLILIECKEPNEIYADYVHQQLVRYNEVIGCLHFMVVIGNSIKLLYYEEDKLLELLSMPNYITFINGGEEVEYEVPEESSEEIPFQEPFDSSFIENAIDEGFLGNGTEPSLYPFIFNLIGYFFDGKFVSTDEINDLGTRETKFGNVGGGSFPGTYRAFMYKKEGAPVIVSFAVLSIYNRDIENDKGATCLLVAINFGKINHLSLELRIDKYVSLKNGNATIWHDGTLTVGKLGMAKRHDVLSYIYEKAPHLVQDSRIFLGTFDLSKRISVQQPQAYDFIKRTIEYAIIRDEFRASKKRQ